MEISERNRDRAIRVLRLIGTALTNRDYDLAFDLTVTLKSLLVGNDPPKHYAEI